MRRYFEQNELKRQHQNLWDAANTVTYEEVYSTKWVYQKKEASNQ